MDQKIHPTVITEGFRKASDKALEILDNIGKKVDPKDEKLLEMKKAMLGDAEYDFIALFNNRNIRRKMPGDLALAFNHFVEALPENKRKKVALIFHTQPADREQRSRVSDRGLRVGRR